MWVMIVIATVVKGSGYTYAASPSLLAVEFKSQATCQAAAKATSSRADIKSAFCVQK